MSIKRILIPVIAGLLTSPAVLAADVDTPSAEKFFSNEYLSTADAADTVASGALAVTLDAEYAVNDVVTWDVTGSAVEAGFGTSVISPCVDVVAGIGSKGLTFGRLSSDANGAQYRVTEVDETCDLDSSGLSTVGVTVTFSAALTLGSQEVDAANTIRASFSAETNNGLPLDTTGGAARSVDLVQTGSQFKAAVDKAFDGIVDVNQDRLQFAVGDPTVDEDTLLWTVTSDECPLAPADCNFANVAAQDQEVTITGDFGWVVDTDDVAAGIQPAVGLFTTSCANAAVTATELTCDAGYDAQENLIIDTSVNLDADLNRQVLPATTFVGTHVLNFLGQGGVASTLTVSNVALGAWTLNGFQAEVAYMPFQTGIGQVIYLANRGTQDGAITVDWIDAAGNSGSFDIGILNAGSTKSIGPLINAGLPAAQRASGRLALTITANVPACDAQINAQYNVSGDRAFSVTRDNCD